MERAAQSGRKMLGKNHFHFAPVRFPPGGDLIIKREKSHALIIVSQVMLLKFKPELSGH